MYYYACKKTSILDAYQTSIVLSTGFKAKREINSNNLNFDGNVPDVYTSKYLRRSFSENQHITSYSVLHDVANGIKW
jgi:hypothetical protein